MTATPRTTWGRALERSLLLGCAFWACAQTIPAGVALTAGTLPVTRSLIAAAFVLQLSLVALLARGAFRGLPPWGHAAGLILGWAALCAAAPVTWIDDPALAQITRLGVPVAGVQCLQLWAIATAPRFRSAFVTIAATGPAFMALHAPDHLDLSAMENWLSPTSASLALAALVAYLRSGSAYAEQLDEWNRAARARTAAAVARDRAQAIARRVIHDDVINALRALESEPRPTGTAEAVAASLRALADHRELASRSDLVTHLVAAIDGPVAVQDHGWPVEPPAHVLDAFAGAGAEALRNAARHARASGVQLRIAAIGRACLLEIHDDGCGFDVDTATGFGLRQSVTAPMADVGGEARIDSEPGRGTSVRLTWQPAPPPPREQVTPYAASQRAAGFLRISLPLVVASGFLAFHHTGREPLLGIALGLVLCALVPLAAWYFSQRPATLVSSLAITILCSSLTAIGLANLHPGGLLGFQGWIVGFAGNLTMFMAFDARVRHTVLPVVAQTAVIVHFADRDPTLTAFEPLGAILTPVTIVGFSSLFGVLLRRGAQAVRQGEATVAARLDEGAWLEAQASVRAVWLERLRADVTPFLRTALETPHLEPTRREAAVLAARCRDELNLDHPLPEPVRRVVDAARRCGTTVTFRTAPGEGPLPGPLLEALVGLLRASDAEIVTVLPGDTARIVVLPALTASQARLLPPSASAQSDEVRTVIDVSSDRGPVAEPTVHVSLRG